MPLPCNLVIQSANFGWDQNNQYDVTQDVQGLLTKQYQPGVTKAFSFTLAANQFPGYQPAAGATPSLGITFSWNERGNTWNFTSAWAAGQTVNIPIETPPKILCAVYSSPNVTLDVTNRLQTFVNLHAAQDAGFQIGSAQFLNAMFGSALDPDLNVTKSLSVQYSRYYMSGGQLVEKTYAVVGNDFQNVTLI